MELSVLDLSIVVGYCLLSVLLGVVLARRARGSIRDFFLGGSSLPWWVIGTSMVATTFAVDTPLAVTGYVRTQGIWGNWFVWCYGLMHLMAVVLFARLWRRVGVVTDQELIEVRYAGRPARILRVVKVGYLATLYNFIVMGWVINAMARVLRVCTGADFTVAVMACVGVAAVYSVLSGFWGVVATDLVQFALAMVASVILAFFAVDRAGGMGEILSRVDPEKLAMLPAPPDAPVWSADFWTSPIGVVLVYLTFLWWGSQNSDGGGMLIQRMLAAKDERHARLGTLWFALGHYAIRFWPWVAVAAASLVLLPVMPEGLGDNDAYPRLAMDLLPTGLRGLLVAAFFAAFMSTIDTHLNWGASYLVNDVYKRFLRPRESDRHYVGVSRACVLLLTIAAAGMAHLIGRIEQAWFLVASMGMGIGSVLVLRWFWWRVNAWSELSALAASVVLGIFFHVADLLDWGLLEGKAAHLRLVVIAPVSVAVWVTVTFLTKPVPRETLQAFYRLARPGGFWRPVMGDEASRTRWGRIALEYFGALALVFGATFGIGCLVFGRPGAGGALLGAAALGALVVRRAG